MKTYFTIDQLAEQLGVSKSTLACYRMTGDGPVFVKFGRTIMYPTDAVEIWMAQNTYQSTAQYSSCRCASGAP